jgi:predicted HTH transcriptional regulator
MTDEEIFQRLFDHEDNRTERKQAHQTDEIRKTLVAFANSVPASEKAILFVGVSDNFELVGVGDNPDKTQISIRRSAEEWCFPPIQYRIRALHYEEKEFLAVIIEASHESSALRRASVRSQGKRICKGN